MLLELLKKNRSYRRFNSKRKIERKELTALIEMARLCPSARNMQPLKYCLVHDADTLNKVFPLLSWASYLKGWKGPAEHERPAAYIIVCRDNALATNEYCDSGLAIQTILLGAVEMGLGGCIMGAFDKKKLANTLHLKNQFYPLYVIALGEPAETVLIEQVNKDIKYWRSEDQIHHVPKRGMDDLIIEP